VSRTKTRGGGARGHDEVLYPRFTDALAKLEKGRKVDLAAYRKAWELSDAKGRYALLKYVERAASRVNRGSSRFVPYTGISPAQAKAQSMSGVAKRELIIRKQADAALAASGSKPIGVLNLNRAKGVSPGLSGNTLSVYIGRKNEGRGLSKSPLANPYRIGKDGDRDEVIRKYTSWLYKQTQSDTPARRELSRLARERKAGRDVRLLCFCSPKKCHGDVIREVVDTMVRFL
jgi:hypothetical protein